MGGSSSPPAGSNGYRYYFDIHMGLCRGPVDEIREIAVGDRLAWQGAQTATGEGEIHALGLFGGDKKEGGVAGRFVAWMGDDDQVIAGGLVDLQPPGPVAGFRRMATFFFTGLVCAVNPYPKAWSFRIRRALKGWDGPVFHPELAQIVLGGTRSPPVDAYTPPEERPFGTYPSIPPEYTGQGTQVGNRYTPEEWAAYLQWLSDIQEYSTRPRAFERDPQIVAMNPAHILYEALTNREWGRGYPRNRIDDASFLAAATTLKDEGFGMCHKWSRRDSVKIFIQSVLDTIGGAMYTDRGTALMKLKLIRGDYVVADLPLFTTSNGIISIKDATTSNTSSAVNEVIVEFHDPVRNEKRSVRVQNLANLQSSGGAFNSLSKTYVGVPTASLALRLAQRDLRANSEGLRRFELVGDRRMSRLAPGDVIRIQDTARGVPPTVMRVAQVKDGTLTTGEMQIVVVQDLYGFPSSTFVDDTPNTWVKPTFEPCIGRHDVFEVPYFMLARQLLPAELALVDGATAILGTVAERGQAINISYDLAIKSGEIEEDEWPVGTGSYCGYVPPED